MRKGIYDQLSLHEWRFSFVATFQPSADQECELWRMGHEEFNQAAEGNHRNQIDEHRSMLAD